MKIVKKKEIEFSWFKLQITHIFLSLIMLNWMNVVLIKMLIMIICLKVNGISYSLDIKIKLIILEPKGMFIFLKLN